MKRFAILTGGGDAPGLNAVIRAAVKTAINEYHAIIFGVRDGFDGFINEGGISPLTLKMVRGILPRGGTILGAANRGNPFARKIMVNGKEVVEDITSQIIENIHALELDVLLVVGGDGTLRIANELQQIGVPIIGIPKTIDNDICGTDYSFGFDTALTTATDAIDKLHTTAEAHHRVMVLELMGRDAGFITLHAGLAGGADVILIPEIPFNFEYVCEKVLDRLDKGQYFSIIAVSEGARPLGKDQIFKIEGDGVFSARLGGIGQLVGQNIFEYTGIETRVTTLGHLQRGGGPSAFDRSLATRFGSYAVRLANEGKFGRMVALREGKIIDIPLEDAAKRPRQVYIHGDAVQTARSLNISFGDTPHL
ncbi:MAG: 6-phosphofructokinase [Anaerolineaceae bacterium]|nr:6-phosphofructokinase [Anaerolineaceae bacterium]